MAQIRIKVVCLECGKKFTVGPNADPQCSRCNSVDIEVR